MVEMVKLTTAPIAANKTVFTKSAEDTFDIILKNVPPMVPYKMEWLFDILLHDSCLCWLNRQLADCRNNASSDSDITAYCSDYDR